MTISSDSRNAARLRKQPWRRTNSKSRGRRPAKEHDGTDSRHFARNKYNDFDSDFISEAEPIARKSYLAGSVRLSHVSILQTMLSQYCRSAGIPGHQSPTHHRQIVAIAHIWRPYGMGYRARFYQAEWKAALKYKRHLRYVEGEEYHRHRPPELSGICFSLIGLLQAWEIAKLYRRRINVDAIEPENSHEQRAKLVDRVYTEKAWQHRHNTTCETIAASAR